MAYVTIIGDCLRALVNGLLVLVIVIDPCSELYTYVNCKTHINPLATLLGKMASVFAQRSEGCVFESHPGPN